MQTKELWMKFDNSEQYVKQEYEILEVLKRHQGEIDAIVYLSDKKSLKRISSVRTGNEAVQELNKLLGENNVKIVEKKNEYCGNVTPKTDPLERIADALERIADIWDCFNDELGCINTRLKSIDDIANTIDDLGECISDSSRGKMFCVTGNITNYV